MDNTKLYIPKRCKVGLQLREGTYTGKLGYIIYHDGKVWRKENSWEGWRHKEGQKTSYWSEEKRKHIDQKATGVEPIEFDNVPTEGFVLNKKVGGHSSGWNHRQTYSRVYDPRGWEFEITVPNLLYILQETSSFKGKGLEGEFVYSWDGKDLVLLPATSPDYIACTTFTELQSKKIGTKDLVVGCTYLTSKMEKLVYLGRFDVCTSTYSNITDIERQVNERDEYYYYNYYRSRYEKKEKPLFTKKYVFQYGEGKDAIYTFLSGLSSLKQKVSDEVHPNYANMVSKFQKTEYYGVAESLVVVPLTNDDIRSLHYHSLLFEFGDIKTADEYILKRRRVERAYSKGEDMYKIYIPSQYNHRSLWNRVEVGEEYLTPEQIKERFGKLVRVYSNKNRELIN